MNSIRPAHRPAARAVESAGFVIVNYAPGAGKAGHIGRHRATCDVPPRERRRALSTVGLAALIALAVILAALMGTGVIRTGVATDPAPAGTFTATAALDTSQVEAGAPITTDDTADTCGVLILDDTVPQSAADALIAAGWTGDPTDGMEALYSPTCSA